MHNAKKVQKPYFDQRLKKWVYAGEEFITDKKNITDQDETFLFVQVLDILGGATNTPEVTATWRLYKIEKDDTLDSMTMNGILTDASFMKGEGEEQERSRKGLTPENIASLEQYAKLTTFSQEELQSIVKAKIEPLLRQEAAAISADMNSLPKLTHLELANVAGRISVLAKQTDIFYPRSHEKLVDLMLTVRERYAEVKYPELYAELKKLHSDQSYQTDKSDQLVGFGPRVVLGHLYYEHFLSSQPLTGRKYEIGSPFEERFANPLLF